jgi:hypothetical protein
MYNPSEVRVPAIQSARTRPRTRPAGQDSALSHPGRVRQGSCPSNGNRPGITGLHRNSTASLCRGCLISRNNPGVQVIMAYNANYSILFLDFWPSSQEVSPKRTNCTRRATCPNSSWAHISFSGVRSFPVDAALFLPASARRARFSPASPSDLLSAQRRPQWRGRTFQTPRALA